MAKREGEYPGKKLSKEELKRRERERRLQDDLNKKAKEEAAKKEEAEVKAEVGALRVLVANLKSKVERQAGGDISKWFRLFDSDRNNRLSKVELSAVLRQAGVYVSGKDLDTLLGVIDLSGDGIVTSTEFSDVMSDRVQPDIEKYVRMKRKGAEDEKDDKARKAVEKTMKNVKSYKGTQDSMSDLRRRDGKLPTDQMSSIMGGAGENKGQAQLFDTEEDVNRNISEIKQLLRARTSSGKPVTYDDLLQMMGKPQF